ncbi:MAG: B12-binding domain-containing radical SAM protein [bacterium]
MPARKVLLLNPPGDRKFFRDYYCTKVSKARYYYHPLDLAYLSGRFVAPYELRVIDAIAESLEPGPCLARIREFDPDVVIFLISSPSYEADMRFLSDAKAIAPRALFVGSGDVYREFKGRAFALHSFLDAALLDFSTPDIMTFLEGANGQIIENVIYRHGGQIIEGEEVHGHGQFSMPVPQWHLFPMDRYSFPFALRRKVGTILTDFGCPYSCTFCPISTLGFKLRDIESVVAEIRALAALGIHELFIRDQTFGVNKQRTFTLCRTIVEEKLDIGWTCFSRVDVVTDDMLVAMKRAGCHTVMFGIETADDQTLTDLKKNTTTAQTTHALELCRKHRLRTVGTFLIGLPGEPRESTLKTIDLAKRIGLDFASFNIATPRFGTNFRDDALEHGWVDETAMQMDSAKSKPIWKNQTVSNDEIYRLHSRAVKEFYLRPGYLVRRLVNVRAPHELWASVTEAYSLLFD